MKSFCQMLLVLSLLSPLAVAQNAQLSGFVRDKTEAVIAHASLTLSNPDTGNVVVTKSNDTGFFIFPPVQSGRYSLIGEASGFDKAIINGIKLDTAANVSQDVVLRVKGGSQSVTVTSASPLLNPTDGAVSTVIDRQLIETMPLNGKDLQTLFELSPGTILNAGGGGPSTGGGFSVDGQRPTANYLSIDGASGNAFVPVASGQNLTGASIATSASGGTNGILPVDAIEEYRMDTSTYTAENGRTPGGQVQVRTRSGTNDFHGSLFENFRNQALDDTDWFVKYEGLTQLPLRMNNFGGTFGGPILKNKLFFFVAHDTLLLNQPTTSALQDVPDPSLMQSAYSAYKPFLSVFPAGNEGPDPNNPGFDLFSSSFPYQIRDHTTSARIDWQLPRSIHVFFRTNLAPSRSYQPGILGLGSNVDVNSYTGGVTAPLGRRIVNELTINRTSTNTQFTNFVTAVGGNNPNGIQDNLPVGVSASTDSFSFQVAAANGNAYAYAEVGPEELHGLRQWNIVDSVSWQLGRNTLKFGGDYLSRSINLSGYTNGYTVSVNLEAAPPYTGLETGVIDDFYYYHFNSYPHISVQNLSLYVNDDWRVSPTLTLNGGIRWEYNPAPSIGPLGVLALQGTSLDPATIAASVSNQPLYGNRYDNIAPRFGFSWSLPGAQKLATVLRGGLGIYFDTGQAATASQAAAATYPYESTESFYSPMAYASVDWTGLSATANQTQLPLATVSLINPHLMSPRTYEWSLTLEQQLGKSAKLSTSYVGNDGERLVGQNTYYNYPNPDGTYPVNNQLVSQNGTLNILSNQSHSNYQALQVQVTGRIGQRLSALASYTWGHAEDNGSTDFSSVGATANNPIANSANDIRHMFAAAVHYAPPGVLRGRVLRSLTTGWGIDTIARLQTASPFTVTVNTANPTAFLANADVVPGKPTVLRQRYDASGKLIPGGVLLNHAAFASPPTDETGNPLRQGDSPTNGYRLFGLTQWDLAASRSWPILERASLTFRIDAFNLLNIANFAYPQSNWSATNGNLFGMATNTYSGFYGSGPSQYGQSGAQLSVFQNGGPREVQLSLKVKF